MKYEWKKQEKELYGAKTVPAVVTVPEQNYIMIRTHTGCFSMF